MQTSRTLRIFGAGVLLLGLSLMTSRVDAGKNSASEVKIAAAASKADASGKQTITVTIDINKGWYIYANPVQNKEFETTQTVVKIYADGKEVDAKVEYPEGEAKSTGEIKYAVYTKQAVIKAHINRPADAKNLEVRVRINTCNVEGLCLLPSTVKVSVP